MSVEIVEGGHADAVAVLVTQPPQEGLEPPLAELAASGELPGEVGEAVLLHRDGGRLLGVGVGKRDEVNAETLRSAGAAAAAELGRVGGTLEWRLDGTLPLEAADQAAALTEGTIIGGYAPGKWKTRENGGPKEIERIAFSDAAVRAAAERAALLAERTNRARDLANTPPNELYPETLAEAAEALADEHEHLTATVLDPAEMEALGMGALLAVGRGSHNEPRLIVLRYEPPGPTDPNLVLGLVGKAITFDAGGISIKPAGGMDAMKGDMAGGAGTLQGIGAIAALGLPVRALAVIAAAENLPSGHAFRPGDILTAANGKTIEIVNTDAEGRLVLADALWYARREGATHILDLATLTGAMEVALGDLFAGFFANDAAWSERIFAAGERSGDLTWPFPLHPRYRRYVDSTYADMKNASTLRQAGAVLAAEFLREFAGEGPWAHVDMAGPGFLDRGRGDYYRVPGGTGYGVRLIAELASSLA
ncbi:MAG: leucyl aminopeptidase family protein [Actinobacteria bacterium]|nr:leucyl aminopeptidase family protein [Actinomycetota bacterium]